MLEDVKIPSQRRKLSLDTTNPDKNTTAQIVTSFYGNENPTGML